MKIFYSLILAFVIIVSLALAQALGVGIPLRVTSTTLSNAELSVVGEGTVDAVPDVAYTDVGVTVNKAPTARDAQNQLTKANDQIVAALQKVGVAKADIKTTNFSVNPNYDYSTGGGSTLMGYNGNSMLSVKIKSVSKVGDVIAVATESGANEIYNTRFTIEKPELYRELARTKAITNAKEQAAKIAKELGIKLGKVTNIVESSSDTYPMYAEKAMFAGGGGGGGADLQPGSQAVTSKVTLFFEKR